MTDRKPADPGRVMVDHTRREPYGNTPWCRSCEKAWPCLPYRLAAELHDFAERNAKAEELARVEVKEAVEEWFSTVSLDDLFNVKGWEVLAVGTPVPDPSKLLNLVPIRRRLPDIPRGDMSRTEQDRADLLAEVERLRNRCVVATARVEELLEQGYQIRAQLSRVERLRDIWNARGRARISQTMTTESDFCRTAALAELDSALAPENTEGES